MFDFPNAPTANQVVTGPNGATWQWDGVKWVASGLWQGAIVIVGDTPPVNPPTGALWWDSVGGQLYLNFQDPTSREWVIANSGGIPDAVNDGNIYARQSQQWVNITVAIAAAPNSHGRNFLHNARFNIQQRGQGAWTASGGTAAYTADRWQIVTSGGDSMSTSIYAFGTAGITAVGEEAAQWQLGVTTTGSSAAGSYSVLVQKIEKLRRLSGRTLTLSFWAQASSGTPRVGLQCAYLFGSGGSPSANYGFNPSTPRYVTISTTWARYSLTLNMPSTVSNTLGTNGDDSTQIALVTSDGANQLNTGVGTQSNTIYFYGMQLENGNVMTPLMQRDPADDFATCQRFFQTFSPPMVRGGAPASVTTVTRMGMMLPVTMRATPTAVMVSNLPVFNGSQTNTVTSLSSTYNTPSSFEFDGNVSAAWSNTVNNPAMVYQGAGGQVNLSADL